MSISCCSYFVIQHLETGEVLGSVDIWGLVRHLWKLQGPFFDAELQPLLTAKTV